MTMQKFLAFSALVVLVGLGLVAPASAQEISGWTSVEWDSSSQIVSVYAETDFDYVAEGYYIPRVSTTVTDDLGNIVASQVASAPQDGDDTVAAIDLSFPGTLGRTYTANSIHSAKIDFSNIYPCPLPCRPYTLYEDYYNFWSFSADTGDYGSQDDFVGPGPFLEVRQQVPHVPSTHSSGSESLARPCGDTRDQLIAEYKTFHVDLSPQCSDFDNTAYTPYFSNSELSKNEDPAYGWALLTVELLNEINHWRLAYEQPMTVNSAYRNPYHNFHLPQGRQGVANSRHMHGDAIDIANPTRDMAGRTALMDALPDEDDPSYPDFVEKISGPCGLGCVHADWRHHSQTYAHTLIADVNFRRGALVLDANRMFKPLAASAGLMSGRKQ